MNTQPKPETARASQNRAEITTTSWPRCTVNNIECRKRDLVIRIADWTRTKDAPCYDVEFYHEGVYDWDKSHSFDASMLGQIEAKRRAIAHAKNLIEWNL